MTATEPVYVAGAFEHPTREAPDRSTMQLHAEVAAGALDDAGLEKDDVDGYLVGWPQRRRQVPDGSPTEGLTFDTEANQYGALGEALVCTPEVNPVLLPSCANQRTPSSLPLLRLASTRRTSSNTCWVPVTRIALMI